MGRLRDEHLLDCIDGDDLLFNEIRWYKIPGYDSYYVSEYGEVASIERGYFHILTWS